MEATLSRSMTNSAWGWSILTSITGGNANILLCIAFICSRLASSSICAVSAVEARMNSTGKSPPPGRAGGVTGKMRIPGIFCSSCWTPGRMSNTVRSLSSHGLTTIPPNPELGKVIWKVKSVSGTFRKIRLTSAALRLFWSRVELADASRIPKMTPWSSVGASSLADMKNIGTASMDTTIQTA